MGLQAQSGIRILMRGYPQKPFRQWTRRENPTGADIVLIYSINRLEKPALIAVFFGEFAGPAIGFSDRRRDHAPGADRGHPRRQLQVDFERVALRGIRQRPQQGKTPLQVGDCFDMSRTRRRILPGLQPLRYGVRGIPTLLIFKGGQVREQIVGFVSRDVIEKALDKNLQS